MDVFRKVKNESELNEQHESITDTVHFENSFMNKELLKTALERIPEMQRTLILLRDLEGYNYKEIEEITGLNESQVKVYLFRARKILKETITAMEAI